VDAPQMGAEIDGVFSPVLETFAFMAPEVVNADELPAVEGDILGASLSFSGAANGVLSIAAPSELCAEFAANVLGSDPDDPDAQIRGADTLGEIANIAAGHLVSRLVPGLATELHPPVVSKMTPAEWEWHRGSSSARAYVVEGLPMVVTLRLRQGKAVD